MGLIRLADECMMLDKHGLRFQLESANNINILRALAFGAVIEVHRT